MQLFVPLQQQTHLAVPMITFILCCLSENISMPLLLRKIMYVQYLEIDILVLFRGFLQIHKEI